MNSKKKLFKRVSLLFFFLITFFCVKGNVFAASFPYDRFDWDSFLAQHKNYWVDTYCPNKTESCVDEVLKTKEKFYVRLYELLTQYDKKGYFIDDNIIIETVFFGLTPDTFADKDKVKEDYKGQEIESGYNIDDSENKDQYIATVDENVVQYFERETDTLKTLMNNMIGYYRDCYGYVGGAYFGSDSNGNNVLKCADPNGVLINNDCWIKTKTFKTNYFDSIGLTYNNSVEKLCEESTLSYSSYVLGDSSTKLEVNEEIYWSFLEDNIYFDKKAHLQEYFSSVLNKTGKSSMNDLSKEEYILYDNDIKNARAKIVKGIKDTLGTYGDFAETPTSDWVYINEGYYSYSAGASNYWWPIGGSEVTGSGNVKMAIGDPTSLNVSSKYGRRTYPKVGMHNGIDISGVVGVDNVIATKAGIVVYSTKSMSINCQDISDINSKCGGGYGNYVILQHNDGSFSLYAHLSENSVTVNIGDSVVQGQLLGRIGSSGSSTGGHLHFEIRIGGNTSQNTVDPLMYISADSPRKNGLEFITDENGNVISDGTLTNAMVYIHAWEGAPKTSGNDYIAFDDGYGYVTIGWGVVPSFHKEKFEALGFNVDNIVVGSKIPKDIVDVVEMQFLQELADSIKAKLSNNGIVLTSNQLDALVSRTYNCGNGGMNGFVDAYKTYGNTEDMYTNFFSKPDTSSGRVSPGLKRRRLGEWLLFSKGQYQITV